VEPVANEQAVIDQFLSNSFPALVAITAPVHAIDIPQERVDETAKRKHEPVAWLSKCYSDDNEDLSYNLWDIDVGEGCFPVYTAPPKRKWVGLTDEETMFFNPGLTLVARKIEAMLKDKNGG